MDTVVLPMCRKHNEVKVQIGIKQKSWKCQSCNREYQAAWFKANKAAHRSRVAVSNERNRNRNRRIMWEYKLTHPCIDCGEIDPAVLDFDHRDPSLKSFGVASATGMSQEKLLREIQKCDVRCANCHRKKTARDRGYHQDFRD